MIGPGSYRFRPDSLTPFGDAKFCDSPPVMRDYLSNEIIFNTPVLNKNLYDFISKDSPALRVGSRRIWKTIRIGAYHFCLYACPASKRCQRVRWKTIRTRAYHSWDAKFCDSPPVMRDYLSNEIIFYTPVLNKNLHDFISRDSPALQSSLFYNRCLHSKTIVFIP